MAIQLQKKNPTELTAGLSVSLLHLRAGTLGKRSQQALTIWSAARGAAQCTALSSHTPGTATWLQMLRSHLGISLGPVSFLFYISFPWHRHTPGIISRHPNEERERCLFTNREPEDRLCQGIGMFLSNHQCQEPAVSLTPGTNTAGRMGLAQGTR